jgi:septum formation protein
MKKVILASSSPRRSELLKLINVLHEILKLDFDETVPETILAEETALYIAQSKAKQIKNKQNNCIYLTSDTVVVANRKVLGKPKDLQEAKEYLALLSGTYHEVITGVCLSSREKEVCFSATSKVYFKKLAQEQINYYVDNFSPLDKAGAYGIQEWIGAVGVEKIEGSYFNIMGLPTDLVFNALQDF